MKGSREYKGTEFGKTDYKLRRALPSDRSCRSWSILPRKKKKEKKKKKKRKDRFPDLGM